MKVNPLANAIQNLTQVKSRREGEGGAGQNSYERMHDTRDDKAQEDSREQDAKTSPAESLAVSDAVVQEVLVQFNSDSQITKSGIHAEIEGRGATLVVILRDLSGQALRRLNGTQFVRMADETRETKGVGPVPMGLRRGKLFDQKA